MAIEDIISEEIETRAPNLEVAQGSPEDFMTEDEMDPMQDPELQQLLDSMPGEQAEVLMQLIKEFKMAVAQGFEGEFEDFVKMKMASAQGSSEEDFMSEEEMIIPDEEIQSMIPMGEQAAQGGRIGYGLGSWVKRKLGLGRKEARAEASIDRPVGETADPEVMRKKLYNYFQNKIGSGDSWKDNFREQWRYPFIQAAQGGRIGYDQGGGIMDVAVEEQVETGPTSQQVIMDWLRARGLPITPENIQRAILEMSRKGQAPSRQPHMDGPQIEMGPLTGELAPGVMGENISDRVTPDVAQMFPHERPEEEINIYDYSDEEIEEIKRRFIEAGGDPSVMDKITRGQVAQGGRIGYQYGNEVTADAPGVRSQVPEARRLQIEGNQMAEDAINKILDKFYKKFPGIKEEVSLETMIAMLQREGVLETEGAGIMDIGAGMDMITPESVRGSLPGFTRGLAQGGRVPYGLGSLVKGVFKGAKKGVKSLVKSVKKFAKSDLGKAALLYIATAGMANIGAGAMGQPWLKGGAQWLRPSNVFGLGTGGWGNIGKSFTNLGFGAGADTAASKAVTGVYPVGTSPTLPALMKTKAPATFGSKLLGSFKENPMPWILGTSLGAGLYTKMNPGEDNLDELMRNYKGEVSEWDKRIADIRAGKIKTPFSTSDITYPYPDYMNLAAEGGRIGRAEGGLMDLGGLEKDYRAEGGFVPIGGKEKADDVPARLSRNEFVFTADAVRNAGGGDVDKGSEVMENIMTNLENGGNISEESQGLEGARDMFEVSERLSEVV